MAFVCLGMEPGTSVLSGQSMEVCHPRIATDPAFITNGQRTLGTFAFIPNAGRGELAVADMDHSRLLDLTPQAPGYGMLPVGGDPEAAAASQDGRWVVTANRTSCDLTLVDPARLLVASFSTSSTPATPATGSGDAAHRLAVRTGSGVPLQTATGEIAFLPPTGSLPRVVATFPGCDLVAVLDLSFDTAIATITSAYYVRPDLPGRFQAAGSEPVCPVDCATGATGAIDGGSDSPDGAVVPAIDGGTGGAGFRLQPLALAPDGTRVYVGSLLDTAVTSFDIGADGLGNPIRIELADGPGGISRLRLGIDPFPRADRTSGTYLSGGHAFLYAFAADDSIRVLEVDGVTPVECDVNIPAALNPQKLACLPVGTAGHRPLALGPGIRIPTFINPDSPPPLPRDLAFADLQRIDSDTNVHALFGQFGFLLASNGQVYVLNLAPIGEDGTATNSFRDVRDVGKSSRTPLAVSIAPQRSVPPTDQAFATTASFSSLDGPLLKSFSTDQGVTTSWLDFPDPDNIVSRAWDVVWEGALPGTARSSGIVRDGNDALAGTLGDAGAAFCANSVRPGDVLMFAGCTQNSDCQPDDLFSCQVSVSGARGMCLPKDPKSSTKVIENCARFMGSRMRYEIAQATPTSLDLRLKLDEVPKTTLNPCKRDADCWPDTDHGLLGPDGGGRRAFACVEIRTQERRCVQRCNHDADCRAGHVCQSVPWTLPGASAPDAGLCVEAPPIDAGCFPQPMTTYSVRAGHAFMVYGSSMPKLHDGRVVAGTCQQSTSGDPALVNRIPLSAPQCQDGFFLQFEKDPATGADTSTKKFVQQLDAQAGSNPCLYQGAQQDGAPNEVLAAGAPGDHIRAFFQNPQIRFVMTNLEQYAGDLLGIHFELQYGFVPLTVPLPPYEVLLTLGTRILTGPTITPESPVRRVPMTDAISYPYLYVVDQGRTALTPGSRGQVLRINPRAGSTELATFNTTYSGSTPFQLQ